MSKAHNMHSPFDQMFIRVRARSAKGPSGHVSATKCPFGKLSNWRNDLKPSRTQPSVTLCGMFTAEKYDCSILDPRLQFHLSKLILTHVNCSLENHNILTGLFPEHRYLQ